MPSLFLPLFFPLLSAIIISSGPTFLQCLEVGACPVLPMSLSVCPCNGHSAIESQLQFNQSVQHKADDTVRSGQHWRGRLDESSAPHRCRPIRAAPSVPPHPCRPIDSRSTGRQALGGKNRWPDCATMKRGKWPRPRQRALWAGERVRRRLKGPCSAGQMLISLSFIFTPSPSLCTVSNDVDNGPCACAASTSRLSSSFACSSFVLPRVHLHPCWRRYETDRDRQGQIRVRH